MPSSPKKLSILFVCSGNTARSQMAEGIMRHHFGDKFEVHSAGIVPGKKLPAAVQAMAEIGIDITGQEVTSVQSYYDAHYTFDYVIIVCARAAQICPVFPSARQMLRWDFPDPAMAGSPEGQLEVARKARDQILAALREWMDKLPEERPSGTRLRNLFSSFFGIKKAGSSH